MDIKALVSHVDHTQLSVDAGEDSIRQLCAEAVHYGSASVCVSPSYVRFAKECIGDRVKVCTVIGFPNGYSTTAVKAFEAGDAIKNGADEIDMVINIGWLKDKKYTELTDEIKAVKVACLGRTLKVIIETCLLSENEKIKMCEIVTAAGADYIKTSTGFSKSGAAFEDIELFSKHIGKNVKIKAAGGIKTLEDAERFMELGADRLGTSRIIALIKNDDTDKDTY